MKAVTYKLNTILAALVGVICLAFVLIRTFMPQAILPLVDIPNLAAVCAAALVVDCYFDLKSVPKRDWALTAVLAVLTFWLLPWASGVVEGAGAALRVGVIGGLLFTAMALLFNNIRGRLVSAKSGFLAPMGVGAVMYLACQCFAGMLL